jgi:hypothetical protein
LLISRISRLRNFSIVIEDIDVALAECELGAGQEADLQQIGSSCKDLLTT